MTPGQRCADCPRPLRPRTNQRGYKGANGRCEACDRRWRKAGRPGSGPPPPMTAAERTARSTAASKAAIGQRLTEYAESRRLGFSVAVAAADAGVGERTGWRYEKLLAAMDAAA